MWEPWQVSPWLRQVRYLYAHIRAHTNTPPHTNMPIHKHRAVHVCMHVTHIFVCCRYACMHAHTHTHTHKHMHTDRQTCVHDTSVKKQTSVNCVHTHMLIHITNTHTQYTHTHTHTHNTHTHTHTHTHNTHTHTHTQYTHTHTHTHNKKSCVLISYWSMESKQSALQIHIIVFMI